MNIVIQKSVLTVLLVACYFFLPLIGYESATVPDGFPSGISPAGFLLPHVLYIFSHANIWHLAGNLFVLWLVSKPLHLLPAFLIAVLCSFLPAWGFWSIGMTVGFSGVVFAVWGIKWGRYCRRAPFRHVAYAEFCIRALPFALLGVVIPHINWCLHLYCMLAGFIYGRYILK